MSTWILLFKFYAIVTPVPPLVSRLAIAVVATCAGLALLEPSAMSAPLAALLVLQIFAASSGVVGPARRGHYDALLARGIGRAHILWGHWLASAAPGAACWAAVAGLNWLVSGGQAGSRALTSGSVLALWFASSIPWATTVALPRFSAAIAWLVVLVTTLTMMPSGQSALVSALVGIDVSPWSGVAALVYPMGLIGRMLSPEQWTMLTPGLVVSVAGPAAAFVWFVRADIPLESSQ